MHERRTVLIIDDEIDLCLLLKGYFVRKDFEVYISHNLNDGLSLLGSLKPDILFLDNNLPDGEGWSHAPQIAKEFPRLSIVLISAFHPSIPVMPADSEVRIIEKPITLNDLDKQFNDI